MSGMRVGRRVGLSGMCVGCRMGYVRHACRTHGGVCKACV